MANYKIIKYDVKYFDKWNKFVENSNNGTIFHRLDFLNYHGNKFKKNEHHLIILKGDTIFGVINLPLLLKTLYAQSICINDVLIE